MSAPGVPPQPPMSGPLTDAEAKRFGVMISLEGIIHNTSLEIAEAFRRLQGEVAGEQERVRAEKEKAWQQGWVVGWNHFPDSQNPYSALPPSTKGGEG